MKNNTNDIHPGNQSYAKLKMGHFLSKPNEKENLKNGTLGKIHFVSNSMQVNFIEKILVGYFLANYW